MSEVAQTLEGWYALHDFRTIDWTAWRLADESEREQAIAELNKFLAEWATLSESRGGSTVVYSVVGQKADLAFMHLRETLEDLNALKTAFSKTSFASFTYSVYSYVSVVELSNYMGHASGDPMENPEIIARLKPALPNAKHICFYPMNKRRSGEDNWYSLSMDERKTLMRSHGMIGRTYAGKVKQIITGSVGFDNWEWGVTLFADDPIQFKKLVYEMRFDEVSARYGEFGDFYIGNRLDEEKWQALLSI